MHFTRFIFLRDNDFHCQPLSSDCKIGHVQWIRRKSVTLPKLHRCSISTSCTISCTMPPRNILFVFRFYCHVLPSSWLIVQQGVTQHRQQYNRILRILQPLSGQRVAGLVAKNGFVVRTGQGPLSDARIGTCSVWKYNCTIKIDIVLIVVRKVGRIEERQWGTKQGRYITS